MLHNFVRLQKLTSHALLLGLIFLTACQGCNAPGFSRTINIVPANQALTIEILKTIASNQGYKEVALKPADANREFNWPAVSSGYYRAKTVAIYDFDAFPSLVLGISKSLTDKRVDISLSDTKHCRFLPQSEQAFSKFVAEVLNATGADKVTYWDGAKWITPK